MTLAHAPQTRLTVPTPPEVLKFGRGFKGYKPEQESVVRTPDIKGDYLSRARKAREMLRSMTPEQALEMLEFHENLTMFEAVARAKTEGWLVVPNDVMDRILTETKEEYGSTWTGTFIIYEAPDKPFGKQFTHRWKDRGVNYAIKFTVPEKFRGKVNCALVVEHPDFELIDLGNNKYDLKVADESLLHLIENFPGPDGWYMPHAETGVPHGKRVEASQNSRYLWRLDDSSYAGRLVRGDFDFYYKRRYVLADCRPSDRFGVAVINVGKGESQ